MARRCFTAALELGSSQHLLAEKNTFIQDICFTLGISRGVVIVTHL